MRWQFNGFLTVLIFRVQCLSLLILAVFSTRKIKNICGFGRYASKKALPLAFERPPASGRTLRKVFLDMDLPPASMAINKEGTFLKKLWCCVGGQYYKIIWFYQLS